METTLVIRPDYKIVGVVHWHDGAIQIRGMAHHTMPDGTVVTHQDSYIYDEFDIVSETLYLRQESTDMEGS